MFRITCLISFFIFVVLPCDAQITIPESRLTDRLGTTYREVLYETNLGIGDQLQELISGAGEDQNWDFSSLNYVDSTVIFHLFEFTEANDPYLQDDRLAGSTHRTVITSPPFPGEPLDTSFQFQYSTLANGEFRLRGSVTIFDDDNDGQRDTFFTFYDPDFLLIQFPIQFGGEYHDSSGVSSEFQGFPLPAITELDSNFVDGWGTLITPAGEISALRISNKNISRVPGFPTADVTTALNFVTEDGRDETTINLEDEWAFYRKTRTTDGVSSTKASRRPALPDFKLVSVYPHPASSGSQIAFELARPRDLTISLHALNGTQLRIVGAGRFRVGAHQLPLQVEGLPGGSYLLRLRAGGTAVERLIIVAE